jgi:hypothetical protein
MNFICVCGYEESIINEGFVEGHIQACKEYTKQSPLGRIIQRLKSLDDV